jgi:hypothetical protein
MVFESRGWKMRVGIGAGDGGGAHSTFYRAEEGVKGRGGGGGFLIPVGFNIESGRGVDEAPS